MICCTRRAIPKLRTISRVGRVMGVNTHLAPCPTTHRAPPPFPMISQAGVYAHIYGDEIRFRDETRESEHQPPRPAQPQGPSQTISQFFHLSSTRSAPLQLWGGSAFVCSISRARLLQDLQDYSWESLRTVRSATLMMPSGSSFGNGSGGSQRSITGLGSKRGRVNAGLCVVSATAFAL